MRSPFHSLRWRLQLWHGLILLVVITAFCVSAHRLAWTKQLRVIDRGIREADARLFAILLEASDPADDREDFVPGQITAWLRGGSVVLPATAAVLFQGKPSGNFYFSLRDSDGRVFLQSEQAPTDLFLPIAESNAFDAHWRTVDGRREAIRISPFGLRSVVGRDITPELEEMQTLAWSLAASGLAVWLLGLLGGWWLAGRAIQPITAISRTAARIADGNLAERINTSGTDSELDQVSRVLNHTFEQLHATFEQQKQFTADAAHELRTPVTILLSETERILRRDRERTPGEYCDVIRNCHDVATRMRHLIEALLVLARQDGGGAVRLEPVDLAGILRQAAEQHRPLAAARELELELDLRPASCRGDAAALSILAANLVANAIQHHHGHGRGRVSIATGRQDDLATITVSDDGPGIPAEDLPHVFERFYRAEKARTSTAGHAGLGLAIAQRVVENHGGVITASSPEGRGATFVVQLPWYEVAVSAPPPAVPPVAL